MIPIFQLMPGSDKIILNDAKINVDSRAIRVKNSLRTGNVFFLLLLVILVESTVLKETQRLNLYDLGDRIRKRQNREGLQVRRSKKIKVF